MTRLQVIRYTIWGVAAVVLLVFAFVFWNSNRPTAGVVGAADDAVVTIGGPFTLVTDDGAAITEAAMVGKPTLMFFGFTHCPDVCPTGLAELTAWLSALGPEADQINAYFVTVDPERDTQPVLAQYLTAFDPRIVGVTGSPEAVNAMLDAFHVFHEKVEAANGDYTMNHSAAFYLFDADADFADAIDYHDGRDDALAAIRAVLNG